MNAVLHRVLIQQSKRYKTNYEQCEKYKQLYHDAVTALETAKTRRQNILTDLTLLEQSPATVKESIRVYDKVIIPELKKDVRKAENQKMKHGVVNWYDPDFLICLGVAAVLSIPLIGYGEILGSIAAAVLWVTVFWAWWMLSR